MKKSLLFFPLLLLLSTGCEKTRNDVWENAKTAFRYFERSGKELLKGKGDSRQVAAKESFHGPDEEEFVPLKDKDISTQQIEFVVPQSKEVPGEGKIPGIESFYRPAAALIAIFRNVYFNTDDHMLHDKEYYDAVMRMAEYLKKHPHTYVFIEGHCDERASEAYNLALGTKRANFIRSLLIKHGAKPDQLFTISYGKERPAVKGHDPDTWKKNRRAEFKIFESQNNNKTLKKH